MVNGPLKILPSLQRGQRRRSNAVTHHRRAWGLAALALGGTNPLWPEETWSCDGGHMPLLPFRFTRLAYKVAKIVACLNDQR